MVFSAAEVAWVAALERVDHGTDLGRDQAEGLRRSVNGLRSARGTGGNSRYRRLEFERGRGQGRLLTLAEAVGADEGQTEP